MSTTPPAGLPHPSSILLPIPLTLYYKHSHKDFSLENFQTLAVVTNIQHFWQVFNNLDFDLYLNQGSFFLCCGESPLWIEDGGTYSFIVGDQILINNNFGVDKNEKQLTSTPWPDLCLALLCYLLNDNENKNKIEGVSITKKRKAFNCKFATQFSENQPELIENFLSQLPAYFGNSKFMRNNQRKIQFKDGVGVTPAAATYIPYHMRCGGGNQLKKKNNNNKNNNNKKPPLAPKGFKK